MCPTEPQSDRTASRRTFLKTTAAAAITGAVAPTILHAEDKAGSKLPVLGTGDHQYEAIHNWGELPAHVVGCFVVDPTASDAGAVPKTVTYI